MFINLHMNLLAKLIPYRFKRDKSSTRQITASTTEAESPMLAKEIVPKAPSPNLVTRTQARRSSGDENDRSNGLQLLPFDSSQQQQPKIVVENTDSATTARARHRSTITSHDTSMLHDILIELKLTNTNQSDVGDVASYNSDLERSVHHVKKVKFLDRD